MKHDICLYEDSRLNNLREMKILLLGILTCIVTKALSQTPTFTCLNGHSHNDYFQKKPFQTAFEVGMGSIEVDVFLEDKNLYVGHLNFKKIPTRTFEKMYLKPIVEAARSSKIYPLQLVIDVKSEAEPTLTEIIRELSLYPDVFNENSMLKVVISGHRPKPEKWLTYPSFIQFDARPNKNYTLAQWARVGLVSAKFSHYASGWNNNIRNPTIFFKMKVTVDAIHAKGKKIRFWKTPDNERAWETLMAMNVDFINTNSPKVFASFLNYRSSLFLFNAKADIANE